MVADLVKNVNINKLGLLLIFILACFMGSYPMGVVPNNIYRFLNIGINSVEFWHCIGATLMVLFILSFSKYNNILKTKPIQFIGKISFSIYLLHLLILCSFSTLLFANLFQRVISYSISFLITFFISIIIIIILSNLYYIFIEKNINKIINKIYERLLCIK